MKHLIDHLTGRLLGYVNVHSGEWALYTPWDSKEAYGPGLPVSTKPPKYVSVQNLLLAHGHWSPGPLGPCFEFIQSGWLPD